ncbi:hypothetical protein BUALT_Bualt01G0186800 [Buddleja alternifolia]|uniref:Tf2-1-like SH3-like domain-containing protein n=1 Tax=Buddleja alternifolia TaxID=168488 RepID=A0AAV6Y9V2_9LAMI|nr:hypothetical protein BUALT_Bualt01G0186800 [Buddleja alternifolia]
MEEKRAKGLCFFCDDKYTIGHVCSKMRQLFLMEVGDEEEDVEINEPDLENNRMEPETEEANHTDFHISVHAMSGVHDYRTMRVTSHIGDQSIHILIDTGSTHNVLDLNAAKRLGCRLDKIKLFPVSMADGNKIYDSLACHNFSWKMQGVMFIEEMMILPLGGCDVVLGVQWLVQLGDISWNFDKLAIEFVMNRKMVSLRGTKLVTVLQHIGEVAYTLDLPTESHIQPTFHVSQLKRRIVTTPCQSQLPVVVADHGHIVLVPKRVLERSIVPRNNRLIT